AGVHLELLVLRDVVLLLHAGLVLDIDGHLAAPLVAAQLDGAGDLGQDGRVLGLARLEDFGDARQAAGDVHRARRFARLARQQVTGLDLLAVLDFDTRLGGQIVEIEDLAVGAFDGDAGVALALVLDDDELGLTDDGALALFLESSGFAFLNVLVTDRARLL